MEHKDTKGARSVSDGELDLLKVMWEEGRVKVSELRDHLTSMGRSWAYNTVQTLLTRLESKGFVGSEKQGRANVYFPLVSRYQFIGNHLTDLADKVCEGSQTPLVMALVKGNRFSRDEIKAFRDLLDTLDEPDQVE